MFRFAEPQWLYALFLLLFLPAVWWWQDLMTRKRTQAWAGDLAESLTAHNSMPRKWVGRVCAAAGVLVLILGLARPQIGLAGEREEWRGSEIEILIDTSRSMLATDIAPSRLGRAKQALNYLVDHWEGQRVGLIPFAGVAFEVCPLTQDTGALKLLIDALDVQQLPVPGTDLGEALLQAIKTFERSSKNGSAHHICLVVSDGENFGSWPKEIIRRAVENGMRIYTLGTGTAAGAPVPEADQVAETAGKTSRPVTRLDEKALGGLAAQGQGLFVHLTENGLEEDLILQEVDRLEKVQKYSDRLLVWNDEYPLCAGLALVLLLGETLISRRKQAARGKKWFRRSRAAGLMILAAGVLLPLVRAAADPPANPRDGFAAFHQHRWVDAEREFKLELQAHPEDARAAYNYGCSLLVQHKFAEAYPVFVQAKVRAAQPLARDVWYNLGYTAYYLGWRQGDSARWVEAAEAFQQVLLWTPQDEDAGYNLELILRQIKKHTQQTTQRQTQSQGGKSGQQEGGGANLPGSDRTPSEGRSNDQAPPSEQNSSKNQRQKSGDRSSVSEDQKGNKQKGMSRQDALRTLRSLENEEQDLQRNRQPNLNDENLYKGPSW